MLTYLAAAGLALGAVLRLIALSMPKLSRETRSFMPAIPLYLSLAVIVITGRLGLIWVIGPMVAICALLAAWQVNTRFYPQPAIMAVALADMFALVALVAVLMQT